MIKAGEYQVTYKTSLHVKVDRPMLSDAFETMLNEGVQESDINKRLNNVKVIEMLHDGNVQSIEIWPKGR